MTPSDGWRRTQVGGLWLLHRGGTDPVTNKEIAKHDSWPPDGWRLNVVYGCNPRTLTDGEVEEALEWLQSYVEGDPETHVIMVGLGENVRVLRWVDRFQLTDLLAEERT